MKILSMMLLVVFSSLAIGNEEPSKEELKERLNAFKKENKEASVSIAPLIEKLTSILDAKEQEKSKEKKPQ